MAKITSKPREQEGKNGEKSLVPRIRPDIYTPGELCQTLREWIRPIIGVLIWELPTVSSAWVILALLVIFLLTRFTMPSLLGMVGLVVLGVVMPHEEVMRRKMLVGVSVPPKVVILVASRVTKWTNRWVATAQYLFFGQDFWPGIVAAIVALNLVILGSFLDSSTILMGAYCLVFVLPNLWLQLARKWGYLWQRPLPPTVLRALIMARNLLLQFNQDLLQGVEQLQQAVPDGPGTYL